ncbi:MAG: hypothetical protein Q4C96_00675 [Planctomycetia bacterium]|nr:hypothetical protein [Planctomycetia bacterium]
MLEGESKGTGEEFVGVGGVFSLPYATQNRKRQMGRLIKNKIDILGKEYWMCDADILTSLLDPRYGINILCFCVFIPDAL